MQRCIPAQRQCAQSWQSCAYCRTRAFHPSSRLTLRPPHPRKTAAAVPDLPPRCFSNSTSRRDETQTESHSKRSTDSQAHPLSGYYHDLLYNTTYPHRPAVRAVERLEEEQQQQKEPTKEEKMSIVFGTRLAGPGYQSTRYNPETMPPESTWKTINGVPIPPRPSEPDNCCMSGCVHCVWDDYRDDLESWASRVQQARAKISNETISNGSAPQSDMRQLPRKEVASASMSMDDDGGGSESNWELPSEDGDELFAGIPVGIKEFMKTEKKLREKKQQAS